MGAHSDRDGSRAEDAMVAALVDFHRRKRSQKGSNDPKDAPTRILNHFDRRGQRLRGEKLITSELIDRLFRASAAIPARRAQQELELWGTAGATAAGRVRLTNRSTTSASFALVVGEPVEGTRRPKLRFEPATGVLAPGEGLLVRAEATLTGWQSGERVTVPLECRWREGTDRIWVVVVAQAVAGGP